MTDTLSNKPQGIDVSHHQGVIDWGKVGQQGIVFAFAKATDGSTYIDSFYHFNVYQARKHNILIGPYHYYRLHANPQAQANAFCDTIDTLGPGILQPVIDMEEPGTLDRWKPGENWAKVLRDLDIMVDIVHARTGRNVTLYTYPSYWENTLHNPKGYGNKLALWIASYNNHPTLVGDWDYQAFWQYRSNGKLDGIGGDVDLNVFNGSYNQLAKFANIGV